MQPLNLDKILILKAPFWKQLAVFVKKWILQDMMRGKLQLLTGKGFYNKQYAKYKQNFMNRFTNRGGKTAGTKLNSYAGQSVRSNKVGSVNMYLTGQTIDGFSYKSSNNHSMTVGYQDKDADKIIGNEALGRFITTLSPENQDKTLKVMEDEFEKNIKDFYRGSIKIKIGV